MMPLAAMDVKNWSVPFATPTGRAWPVLAAPKAVSYTRATGKVVGNGATYFHAPREDGKRWHAGMDLPCFPGNPVVAMDDGVVVGMISGFVKLGAVVVRHPQCVAVYAEIDLQSLTKAKLKPGASVVAGQTLGFGAINYEGHSMLHLELWQKDHPPPFYTPWYVDAPPPAGLLDPTLYLISLATGVTPRGASTAGPTAIAAAAIAALGYLFLRGRA